MVALAVSVVLLAASAAYAHRGLWGTPRPASVGVRASWDEYGWDELAAIAEELAACQSERAALARASRYGLCAQDGTLDASKTKELTLADGRTVRVSLVGIWHDDRADGGKAGLTFAFADAAGPHAMNHAFEEPEGLLADSKGGWSASDMRSWLADTLLFELPPELRSRIVPVQKRTANAIDMNDEAIDLGKLAGTPGEWIGETTDDLWLFSAAELCAQVPATEELGVDTSMSAVYAQEGTQYQLFAQQDVAAFAPNEALVRTMAGEDEPCTWWLRTKMLEFGDGFWLVGTDGTPLNGFGEDARVVMDPEYAPDESWGPDHARGVIVGFCL